MATTAEISYAIQNDRPSFMIRVSAQKEGDSFPDLRGMLSKIQEAITEFQKSPQAKFLPNSEVTVLDVPSSSPPVQPKDFPDNNKSGPTKMISPKQISLLTRKLNEKRMSPETLCLENGVNRIQDLTMARAREIIRDLTDY